MNALTRLQNLRLETQEAGARMDEMRGRFTVLAERHENGTAPQAVAAHQLFQTPEPIAKRLVSLLGAFPPFCRVLEPSAGLGHILRAFPADFDGGFVAVETDAALCGCLFRMDLPRTRIMQRDFLTVEPSETGLFDCVAMNPPFTMRSDIRHVQHAIRFLKPGGVLAGICMAGPARESALRPMAETWEPLPAGTFRSTGTNVDTILFSICKMRA